MEINKNLYEQVYNNNTWGDSSSKSGPGSNLVQTAVIRKEIPRLLKKLKVVKMLDGPCGDFFWMKEIKNDLREVLKSYIGADIVPELIQSNIKRYGDEKIQFRLLDITKDDLPKVDLVFSRDCFIHFSYGQIIAALQQFKKSGSTYLLTSTYTKDRLNVNTPDNYINGRALNLENAPFNFPKPLAIINEGCTEGGGQYSDKSLALWRIKSICVFRIIFNLWIKYKLPALYSKLYPNQNQLHNE